MCLSSVFVLISSVANINSQFVKLTHSGSHTIPAARIFCFQTIEQAVELRVRKVSVDQDVTRYGSHFAVTVTNY